MPYNILLLPLLAGFLFIARARLFRYATSQLQKEQLLLWASFAGLLLLLLSRAICELLSGTLLGDLLLQVKASIAPFPYMGTAIGTLFLAFFLTTAFNCLIPREEAGLWVYHCGGFDQFESLLLSSALGVQPTGKVSYQKLIATQLWADVLRTKEKWSRFFMRREEVAIYSCFETGDPQLVMVTLSDNKVYVGFVSQLPPVDAAKISYVRILPVWSGYRDKDDRRVYKTTDYDQAVLSPHDGELLIKVVPAKEIMVVGIYVDGTFPIHDVVQIDNSHDLESGGTQVIEDASIPNAVDTDKD